MNPMDRIDDLERRFAGLQSTVDSLTATQAQVHEVVEEMFSEMAQALDVVAASLEDLVPEDERMGWSDHTGIMGRACELQALVRMFRGNLADLHHRAATPSPRRVANV